MKILHTSDWHLGRQLHGHSLIEDQKFALDLLTKELEKGYDALIIAGDLYDRALPPPEAVELLDAFITRVGKMQLDCVVVAGNHDSATRIGFGSRLLEKNGLHIRGGYDRTDDPVTIKDSSGLEVDIFAMPFVETSLVREFGKDEAITNTSEAVQYLLERVREKRRMDVPCILVAHEFVGANSLTSESERIFIGGAHVLGSELFEGFDYVALGHLHRPQDVSSPHIRYSGSLLQYSFSEADHDKGLTVVSFDESADKLVVETIRCKPHRPLTVVEDSFENALNDKKYDAVADHYVSVRITDRGYHANMFARLRERFPYLLELRQIALEGAADTGFSAVSRQGSDTPEEIFNLFLDLFGWEDDGKEKARELFSKASEVCRKDESEVAQ